MTNFNDWVISKIARYLASKEGFTIQAETDKVVELQDAFGFRYKITVELLGRVHNLEQSSNEEVYLNHHPPTKRVVLELGSLVIYTMDANTGFLFMGPAPKYYAVNTKYNLEVGPHDTIEAVLYQYHSVYKEYRSKLIKTDHIDKYIADMLRVDDVTKPEVSNVIHMDFREKRRIK